MHTCHVTSSFGAILVESRGFFFHSVDFNVNSKLWDRKDADTRRTRQKVL